MSSEIQNNIYLSLIIPVYNGSNFIKNNLQDVLQHLEKQNYASELIVVDDGSRDDTAELLHHLEALHPILRVTKNGKNHGKGYTVRHGTQKARGKYIIFNDADLAYPVGEVSRILSNLESGHDVAIACRVLPESRYEISPAFFRYLYTRHLMGRFFNLIVRTFLLPGILDSQAGLKGFTRESAKRIFAKQTLTGFSFDVEVLYLARKYGFKIQQVPIYFRYFFEETTVNYIRDTFRMLKDLLSVKLNDWKGIYR